MTSRQLVVRDLVDELEDPIDAYALCALMAERGHKTPLSAVYRMLACLIALGEVLEIREQERRRFLSARMAVRLRLEDPTGQLIDLPAPALRALLTRIAVARGLPPGVAATVRFGGDDDD